VPITFTVPVTLTGRTVSGRDAFGNDVYTTIQTTLDGVFAPGPSVEQVQGRDVVTTQPTVYLPTGTDASAVDSLTIDGLAYEIDGEPNVWPPNPFTGWQPAYSVEVKLRRVTG
jgi:hypothetical protein